MNHKTKASIREHLTLLFRRRSAIALCCGILTLVLAFYGIIAGVNRTIAVLHKNGFLSFSYYTMFSNTLAALSAAFVLPYAVEGMRRKRFTLPKWVAVTHYTAAVTIAITMAFVLAFMSWVSPDNALGGANLVTHVFSPALILISFFQMESGNLFTWKDRLLGIIPFCLYQVAYMIEVEVIGEENGGWPDIYCIKEYLSPFVAVPLLLLLTFTLSTAIALLSNSLTKKRHQKMYLLWHDELDPIEVRIEAYGLGRMESQYGETGSIQIPYDILSFLAQRYHLETEELMRVFIKGVMIGLKDRKNQELMK